MASKLLENGNQMAGICASALLSAKREATGGRDYLMKWPPLMKVRCRGRQLSCRCMCIASQSALRYRLEGAYACLARTACLSATAGAFLLFVLTNSLGTGNVPNLLCRAKTS